MLKSKNTELAHSGVDKNVRLEYDFSKTEAMLVNFSYTNFKVYLQPTEFTMVAGRFKSHRDSLMDIPGERYLKLLPITAIYGGNSSGKSTFVEAIKCLQHIVLLGMFDEVEPHLFSNQGQVNPSSFVCSFVSSGKILEYRIDIQSGIIQHESLIDVTKGRRKIIFNRIPGKNCEIGDEISKNIDEEERAYACKMGSTLPNNVVFLTTIFMLQVQALLDYATLCRRWFAETLCIISADSRRVALGLDLLTQLSDYSNALSDADTGVENLQFRELNTNIEDLVTPHVLSEFKSSDDKFYVIPDDHSTLLFKEENGKIKAIKCYSVYTAEDGSSVNIPLAKESDGTRRYLHLLPILLEKLKDRVYVVDELDRSLHTTLSQSLIKKFRKLIENKERNLQLIFTTHDVILMDVDNLRKDEIWVTERDEMHQAHLISMAEYKEIRPDKKLRKSYLEGRMGGLPNLNCSL